MEAQRFPEDYDGIIAGAPANNRTRLHMAILWKAVNDEPTSNGNILHDKLSLITRSVLAACPKQKAVPTDAFFSLDPSECHWNPEALLCKASEKNDCLTKPQVEAVRRIYQGPMNATTQTSLYPGVPAGSEAAWTSLPESPEAPFDSLFKWVYGPAWDWRSFDFDRNAKQVDTKLSPALNATNPDLTRYETLGHKLIVYHGWADWLVAPEESIHYFNAVSNLVYGTPVGEYRHTQQTQSFYRLFMVPGMSHCGGGPGLNTIDALPALEKWVEDGVAPEQIVAVRTVKGTTELSRPVCPYPQTAHYTGLGHTNEAASFSCAN
jgi:feruloyl esterase